MCRTNITSFNINDESLFTELDKKYKKNYENATPNSVVYIDDFEVNLSIF